MDLTCGVLIINECNELLLAHSTGNNFYDLPKGLKDPGETPLQAVVRECFEETSIQLDPETVTDLGQFPYNSKKNIHLFKVSVEKASIDINALVCTSMFEHRFLGMLPEADEFIWIELSKENIEKYCTKSMIKLLNQYFGY